MSTHLIHYEATAGTEPAAVLIHGMTCDGSDWYHQSAFCQNAGYRVITLDLRGHGQSMHLKDDYAMATMGADVAALLRHLGVKSAITVGHSMGCRVATEAALQAAEIVRGVALVDGSRQARGDPQAAVEAVRALIEQRGFKEHFSILFDNMFIASSDEEEKHRIIQRAITRPAEVAVPIIMGLLRWDAGQFDQRYSALNVPVHVIQSTHVNEAHERVAMTETLAIPWHAELQALVQEVHIERVPDCGHFTLLDAPARVNAALERLLQSVRE
ncbi:MAG: alpha/beta fold hydrolase [Gammaproteobacteria bacterium]|nr:alpha/beta fold hydrolase [Gammaproteobacteria bacterium]